VKALSGRTTRSASKTFLRQIIVARMTEIFKLVRANLAQNCPPEVMLAELVLAGGGARLEGIDTLASEFFDLPARIGTPMHVGGLTDTIKNPAYATAVGLVLFGASGDSGAHAKEMDRKGIWSRMTSWLSEYIG